MGSKELIFQIFSEFMAKVAILEELTDLASRLLKGFHQALEFIRRPPINKISGSVEQIFQANETKRLSDYVESGCVKLHDKVESISRLQAFHRGLGDHLSKVQGIVQELEILVKKMASEMLNSVETESEFEIEIAQVEGKESSLSQKPEVTEYGSIMSILYSMIKRDFEMQEKIISSLNLKSTSGELESYSLMLSLRPYVNDEIVHQALKLIP